MNLQHTPKINIVGTSQRVRRNGRDTIIAPVVLMVEGVHNGSSGPLFYSADELRASAFSWNGVPVPVHHPVDDSGTPISCNSPDILDGRVVGRLFNVEFNTQPTPRLRGEIHVDVEKALQVDPTVVDSLVQNRPLEVSTGLFSVDESIVGDWKGERYQAIVRNIRPDHLALLPGGRGACSWQDGCGIRANETKGDQNMKEQVGIFQRIVSLLKNNMTLTDNEQSMQEMQRAVQRKLDSLDSMTQVHFLEALYPDHMVYRVEPGSQATNSETRYFRRPCTMGEHGEVEFDNNVEEVRKTTEYVPVTRANEEGIKKDDELKDNKATTPATQTQNKEKEEQKMVTEERKQKVSELIANGAFTDEDRNFLETCECPQFTRIQTLAVRPVKMKANAEQKPVTFDELLKAAPADVQAQHAYVTNQFKQFREGLVARVKANANNKFTDEQLASMDISLLETVANTVTPVASFVGAGGGAPVVNQEIKEAPLEMPKVNFGEKK